MKISAKVSRLPRVSAREAIAAYRKLGYEVDRQRGSHIVLRHPEPLHRRLVVLEHREIAQGTLRKLIREAGLTVEEFGGLL